MRIRLPRMSHSHHFLTVLTIAIGFQWHFQIAAGNIEVFEAWNRKSYKSKDIRYAMFDPDGIMTFDGNINGKSNDLQFPNANFDLWSQNTCEKNPELFFQLCETDSHKAWTGMAICYESQMAQPEINPFFRIQNPPNTEKLVRLICGERQSALFINRTVVPYDNATTEEGGSRYNPFYSLWTSFAPDKKIHFKMPKKPEKQCVLLHLGGENILRVFVTNLRREPIDLYKNVQMNMENVTKYNTTNPTDFMQEFPDMANRKNRLSDRQNFEFLLLDFLPPMGKSQNISIYGWLPMKIKITSKAINPCRIDWRLLESREIKGRTGTLVIQYTVSTGNSNSQSSQRGGSKSSSNSKSDMTETSGGGSIGLPVVSASVQKSVSDTVGSQTMQNSDFNIAEELSKTTTKSREESITFQEFEGQVNVEQMIYTCHGIVLMPDKIRYHDNNGRLITPIADDQGDPVQMPPPPQPDMCQDNYKECQLWAVKGECKKNAASMLVNCMRSCKLCPNVAVENKAKDSQITAADNNNDDDDDDDLDCSDERKYCMAWKRQDECQKNPAYMSRYCRKSCGLCLDIDDVDDAEIEMGEKKQI